MPDASILIDTTASAASATAVAHPAATVASTAVAGVDTKESSTSASAVKLSSSPQQLQSVKVTTNAGSSTTDSSTANKRRKIEDHSQQQKQQQQHHAHSKSAAASTVASSTILSGNNSNSSTTSDSSDSSSDEDDDDEESGSGGGPTRNANQNQQHQHHHLSQSSQAQSQHSTLQTQSQSPQQHQPEGWRVKLYRLNQDGSWDDCGTGRIRCIYDSPATAAPETPGQEGANSDDSTTQQAADPTSSATDPHNKVAMNSVISPLQSDATLCVQAEVTKGAQSPRVLLRTRILLTDAYKAQGDNIITWCEPCYYSTTNNNGDTAAAATVARELGVELALSFQDNCGCLEIWQHIKAVQGRQVEKAAAAAAAQHHAVIQQESNGDGSVMSTLAATGGQWDPTALLMNTGGMGDGNNDILDAQQQQILLQQQQLLERIQMPSPPTLQNLDEIADTIAALQHIQQREVLAEFIANEDCLYLKQLLELFPAAEARGDYPKLATLAACVKTVLLLNAPSILELIVTEADIFEQVCSSLEYDPDLREKANHRWFLRERVKFRTVVPMQDPELIEAIHRSFRVTYLRDTLLRPTMDESSLSTLSSLQTFTHADVVKGVTISGDNETLQHSYLGRNIQLLGMEISALLHADWKELEESSLSKTHQSALAGPRRPVENDPRAAAAHLSVNATATRTRNTSMDSSVAEAITAASADDTSLEKASNTWRQHLAPQDSSPESRRQRRRGSLSFLRELFLMVRQSLQQCDKDDFFSVFCMLEVEWVEEEKSHDKGQASGNSVGRLLSPEDEERADAHSEPNNLLSMLANVLLDPMADTAEKGSVLEILSGVAMHDPSLIRRHCLECHRLQKEHQTLGTGNTLSFSRPAPNEKRQVLYLGKSNDLLSALIFLLDVETDAGALLQVSEIMRIILDTDIMGDHGPLSPGGFADEAIDIPPVGGHHPPHDQHNQPTGSGPTNTEQARFLSFFYENYVEWLVAPFQFTILHPVRRIPDRVLQSPSGSELAQRILKHVQVGIGPDDPWLLTIPPCAVRKSFTVELLSFCVRAHLSRMKGFLLKTRTMSSVLSLLRSSSYEGMSGDRCLKLAALRFLRAVLSVNDEGYHRHIIQQNLFAAVFDVFRTNPVGDNLVSSAIVEMCDFIHAEKIKSLVEHIVRKHLTEEEAGSGDKGVPSLEDVSSPYVSTLTTLRQAFEASLLETQQQQAADAASSPEGSRFFNGFQKATRRLSGKALEDQRKFREMDQDESYFDDDDNDSAPSMDNGNYNNAVIASSGDVDEMDDVQDKESLGGSSDLHRTPRMFSLATQESTTSLLNHLEEST